MDKNCCTSTKSTEFRNYTMAIFLTSALVLPSLAFTADIIPEYRILHQESAFRHPDYDFLDMAVEASHNGKFDEAIEFFQTAELSEDAWISWAGVSGQVATYRMTDRPDAALEVTQRVTHDRPDLAGLMMIWDADTLGLKENADDAIMTYQLAADEYGTDIVDGSPIGATALKQLSFAYLELKRPWDAAQSLRRQLLEFPKEGVPDSTVARVLVYEALSRTVGFPIYSIGTLSKTGVCSLDFPCLVRDGKISRVRKLPKEALDLDGSGGIGFVLSESQLSLLYSARKASTEAGSHYSGAAMYATSCTPNKATDGFSDPYSASLASSAFGYLFMAYPDSVGGYHPGLDINTADDCNDDFLATAQGCVTETIPVYPTENTTTWGTMTVSHYYYPAQSSTAYWTSQYGHGDYSYYSQYSAVAKGAILGEMDGVPGFSCHLHFEIREYDHPSRADADNYSYVSSQTNVGDYYQDPDSFIDSHTKYTAIVWGDENHFTRYGTTSWSSSSTVGDEDYTASSPSTDMRYVTRASSKTAYARTFFTPSSSGTYYLYAFIPWNYATSSYVPMKIVQDSTGTSKLSATVNQLGSSGYDCGYTDDTTSPWTYYKGENCDEWVYVGSASLSSGTKYYVEIANNTSSSDSSTAKVALDDIMLIKK